MGTSVAGPRQFFCTSRFCSLHRQQTVGLTRRPHPLLALFVDWIPNAVLYCLGFWADWQIGCYLTAWTIVVCVSWIASSEPDRPVGHALVWVACRLYLPISGRTVYSLSLIRFSLPAHFWNAHRSDGQGRGANACQDFVY